MNNSCYGETCEDVRKYTTVSIICGEDKVKKIQNKQNSVFFDKVKLYDEFSASVLCRKKKVVLDKPRYVGAVILSLSKVVMYKYHFNGILPNFPGM